MDEEEESRPVKIAMGDIVQETARQAGVSESVLLSQGRGRLGSRLRAEAAYVGREVGGISLTEAAKYLRRDLSTISLAVKRLEEELGSDRHQRDRLKSICDCIRRGRRRKYQITKA
jgi:chromosomal replication initiation ATPase DnaA